MSASHANEANVDPLEVKLRKWLATQGYPLEMRTSRVFRAHDIKVTSSDYYLDKESGDSREIDITARLPLYDQSIPTRYPAFLCPVVECKSSPGKPWVLFSGGTSLHPIARVAQRFVSSFAMKRWDAYAQRINPTIETLASSYPLFAIESDPAYSAVRSTLGTSREDAAYGAMMSVTKAAHAVANKYGQNAVQVAIPIIVVDAPIFTCKLDDDGKMQLERVDRGTITWKVGNPTFGTPHSIITVVSESALPDLCEDIKKTASSLCNAFFSRADTVRH
ncbi:hypothetical protein ACF1GW_32055 [Streptomyces achromogenes]|uniref:hypothetical protein n=1 Tax=Streptomyces achromogenes TaxID=67255 RepID=UPI0036FB9637